MGNENDCGEEQSVTKKPKTKGFRETSRRMREGQEQHLGHRASMDWRHDSKRVCNKGGFEAEIAGIDKLKEILMKSRTAEALMTGDNGANLEICYDRQIPTSQYYPRAVRRVITLNPYRPKGDLLNLLSRELRRAWQHRQGALVNPLNYEPDEAILVNRAQQADTLMISVKIAWELRLAGEPEAWNYLGGSPMADVSRTFELKVQTDFRTLNNGEAPRAAYDKFFEDCRTKLHDKRIIHQMLLDESGYIRSGRKEGRIGPDLFSKLGKMPHGKNYLSACKSRAPTDLCYSTVEDRSNANFLWFIKFERSFQEKELEMVKQSVKLSAEIVDFAKWATQRRAPEPGR